MILAHFWASKMDICSPTEDFVFFFGSEAGKGIFGEYQKMPISRPFGHLQKNKGTLFSPTLKVEENKVPLFFWLEAWQPRYGHFVDLTPIPPKAAIFKRTQLLYLSNFTSYQENKDTFISSILKVEERKVSLFSS